MVLIISVNNDFTTTHVIRWLKYMGKSFLRINEDDRIFIESVTESDFLLKINNRTIRSSEISSVWYRRGNLFFSDINSKISPEKISSFLMYNKKENKDLSDFIHNLFKTKKSLNNFCDNGLSKLAVLHYCKTVNIKMPSFIITQSKKKLLEFYDKHPEGLISKAINNVFVVTSKDELFSSYSYKPTLDDIQNLPETFTPTFFQAYTPKKHEIRTFYLDGSFYSMVIFSQNNPKTKIDFRHYDKEKPNRESPFKLPEIYEEKIDKMLKHFDINCASLDIILSKDNSYYLLDINPIGQFGMTSKPCNYQLEKKVAEYL